MATAQLWRPMADMKSGFMHLSTALTAFAFILTYCQLVRPKTLQNGIKLGVLVGLVVAIGMGIGSYAYMPITGKIAAVWFIATLVNFTVAGAVVGKLVTCEVCNSCDTTS
ncbi:MAG: hypothetical protein O3A01_06570 [bacterium]|nr:hypothetical protein [bacterium]